MTRKKKPVLPKPRRVWKIQPATRVKPSGKIYNRTKSKKRPGWVGKVDWFGDKPLTS